jgi:hypothetical protein
MRHIYVKKFRYQWTYQKKHKTDSRGFAVVHFVISSNANMYMNDLTGAKMMMGEFILCHAVKDISHK